jgi:branched-chain amino acid transport system permease protein
MTEARSRLASLLTGQNTIGNGRRFRLLFVVTLGLFIAYPLLFGAYAASQLTLFMIYAIYGLSLSLIWGYVGILSFGQSVFFGLAGYAYGVISLNVGGAFGATLGLFGSVLFAAGSGFLLAYFMFYGGVRDVFATITMLVTTIAIFTFMEQTAGGEWVVGSVSLGGSNGITQIPDVTLGIGEMAIVFDDLLLYYVVLLLLLGLYLAARVLVNSNYGYAMVALREDEDRTRLFGYNSKRIKLVVFTASAGIAGLGGTLYAAWGSFISPSVFGILFATLPVIWVSVGGRESLLGGIIAAITIQWGWQEFANTGSEWALVIIGALLLLTILLFPDGVVPRLRDLVIEPRETLHPVIRIYRDIQRRFGDAGDGEEVTPE